MGKNSKSIYIPSAIFLVVFATGKREAESSLTHDLWNYKNSYENYYDYFTLEVGYKYLVRTCYSLDMSFDLFFAILVTTIIILMLFSVKRIGGNMHLTLFCWLLYFILITPSQLRNQSALAIMMIGLFPFYVPKLKSRKWLFMFLFLSILFHFSFVVYIIPLVLCLFKDKNMKILKFGTVASLVLFVFLYATSAGAALNKIILLLDFMGELPTKYENYAESQTGLSLLYILSIYIFAIWCISKIREKNRLLKNKSINYVYENIDIFYRFLIYSCFFLPLLLINISFYRIFRDLTFIAIAYFGIYTALKSTPLVRRLQTFFAAFIISGGWFFFDVVIKGYWQDYTRYFFDIKLLWEI